MFVLLVTLTLLVPALAGGTPYVWCVGMHRAQMSCCCHGRHQTSVDSEHEHPASDVDSMSAACCVGQRLESVPATHAAVDASVAVDAAPAISWLTLAALLPIEAEPTGSERRRYDGEARAGPEPSIYAIHCAYLN